MTCHWNNLTGHDLTWPEEMCVAFMYYSPGQGFLICDSEEDADIIIAEVISREQFECLIELVIS